MKLKRTKVHLSHKLTLAGIAVIATGLIGAGALAAHLNTPAWRATANFLTGRHDAASPVPKAVAEATATPAPTPTPTAKLAATPTPVTRNLDFKDGPCQGIHGADAGCVTKNTGTFQIASLVMWPQQVTCSGSDVTVAFNALTITRHYLSGSGGTAQVQVQYSDGTSSTYSATFTPSTDVQSITGISHTFTNATLSSAKYMVHLVSPASNGSTPVDQSWMPLLMNGTTPAGCPTASPSSAPYQW